LTTKDLNTNHETHSIPGRRSFGFIKHKLEEKEDDDDDDNKENILLVGKSEPNYPLIINNEQLETEDPSYNSNQYFKMESNVDVDDLLKEIGV